MADFKNQIMLGVQLDSQGAQTKLEETIKKLNENKISLDINIKDSNVAKQLETLTGLAKNFKEALGGNVSLGNIDKVMNETVSSVEKLNGEILKTTQLKFNNGTVGRELTETAEGIGTVVKQIKSLQDGSLVETSKTIVTNNTKIKQSIEDIANAQKRLNDLELNSVVNQNKVADLKNMFSNSDNFGSDNELKNYLNQVKELETQEKQSVQLANEIQDAWDKTYQQRVSSEQKALEQIEANEKKAYEQEISRLGEQAIAQQKAEQDLINQMANGREKSELKSQKTDRSEELAQAKAINQALEEQTQILAKQQEAYKQIDVLKSNGIISNSDINNLEKMTQEAKSLQEINNVLKSIMSTSMMKESSIVSLSKQIEDAEQKLTKMRQTLGENLPSGFVSSVESQLNKLKDDLKSTDLLGFNGLKNSLNSVKTQMIQVDNETKQMMNSLKETNSAGIFSSMGDFLGKIGIFYGVQQVFQEITNQLKEASKYIIEMDTRMSNMQMITGKTREEITQITSQFKDLASQLHETNTNIMAGSEELMRAGYDDSTTKKMLEASTMASKISGQTNEATTSQLIAIKNAYNMTGDQMQHVIDTMSKLDNSSATSLDFDDLVA
jgi:DNA repair exonuclease SbcCD ATPase subunit